MPKRDRFLPAAGSPDGFLSTREAGAIIGVSYVTITRWIAAGGITGARKQVAPGGWRWLVPVAEVDRLAGPS